MTTLRLLLCTFLALSLAQQRDCERQKTCYRCGTNKYSYYQCPNPATDCLSSEVCVFGFCCPKDTAVLASGGECPDGSNGQGRCTRDGQCGSQHICAFEQNSIQQGLCCPSCRKRRSQIESERGITGSVYLPLCETDGRSWSPKQCSQTQCWCVTQYGRLIGQRFQLNVYRDCLQERQRYGGIGVLPVCNYIKTGQCPVVNLPSNQQLGQCRCDNDCSGTQKCCIGRNGKMCMTVVGNVDNRNNKAGVCPNTLGTTTGVFNQCSYDSQCSGQQKCCTSPFGRRCSLPTDVSQCSGTNEKWSTCSNKCEPDCGEPNRQPCSGTCTSGCQCKLGYIRRDPNVPNSPCIRPSQCSTTTTYCSGNKQYQSCGTACPIGCDNLNNQPAVCTTNCVAGCFCKSPWIFEDSRNWRTSRCVLRGSCPLKPGSCSDPRREYRQCGTNCPSGCDRLSPTACTLQCVAGCFCKDPYILEDADDKNSRCVLRSECRTCTDPKKSWNVCGSACPSGCNDLNPICVKSCSSGCFCRNPYILQDAKNRDSRCVLRNECTSVNSCSDPLKQYLTCGSACPIGCDNLNPSQCAPCQSGCFCKSGYVFEDSKNWRNSRCIRRDECNVGRRPGTCPSQSIDTLGSFCNFDSECPPEQKCCPRPGDISLTSNRRCICPDPNAVYKTCGSSCPDYCGQSANTVCGSACKQGCFCRSGYLRLTSDPRSQCVLRSQCTTGTGVISYGTINSAIALVRNRIGLTRGKITFTPEGRGVRITGQISGVPAGEHGLTIHQYGDIDSDCNTIGPHYNPTGRQHGSPNSFQHHVGDLGNINAPGFGNTAINILNSEITFSGTNGIIGRSIAIHERRDDLGTGGTFSSQTDGNAGRAIACGVIGVGR